VVNKTGNIESKFRTFPMEVIAGEDNTLVEVKQVGARFRFDFRKVYWNSRLQHEHEYIVKTGIPPGSVVADMFCGVGPFAIPLALPPGSCKVLANDLNPYSFAALQDNVKLNKVSRLVECFNMDGRDFVDKIAHDRQAFQHVLMNLPADGISFTDVFVGIFARAGRLRSETDIVYPKIHTYCFSKTEALPAARVDVTERLLRTLELLPPADFAALPAGATDADYLERGPEILARAAAVLPNLQVREIRDVAPRKLMLCVEFSLTEEIAFATSSRQVDNAAGGAGARRPRDSDQETIAPEPKKSRMGI
jgi:tRNA (guanine37-N1)-methyltransferase